MSIWIIEKKPVEDRPKPGFLGKVHVSSLILIIAVAVGLGFIGGSALRDRSFVAPAIGAPREANVGVVPAGLPGATRPESFASLARAAMPAVVNISTSQKVQPRGYADPFQFFFGDRFPEERPRAFTQQSLGSGFLIESDGTIVTNEHVIRGAEKIQVRLADDSLYEAKVLGADPKTDLALIKIKTKKSLPILKLGDSERLQVGDWVVAIGNPFGLSQTVTAGIVSAKDRVIGTGPYDDFIQTDASINPGNSGGPLLNTEGEVVGINTAILSSGQGLGFAIPANMARTILVQLKEKGRVSRGWVGVSVQTLNPELVKSLGLRSDQGALVSEVIAGGPAERAGIQRGDLITSFDGKAIKQVIQLPSLVASISPGKQVEVRVLREGEEKSFRVTIKEMPEKVPGRESRG